METQKGLFIRESGGAGSEAGCGLKEIAAPKGERALGELNGALVAVAPVSLCPVQRNIEGEFLICELRARFHFRGNRFFFC